jgi:uncharacterized membrane protein
MIESVAAISGAIGMWFNARGDIRLSWWIWLPSNLLMAAFLFSISAYWTVGLFGYYAAMSAWGLWMKA